MSSALEVEKSVLEADVVIGAVLIPGALAPKLVTAEMIREMKEGAVVATSSIDQGGCFETSHATTHSDPVYVVDGVTHYCVSNMPGAVPITSTMALTNVTLPVRRGDRRPRRPRGRRRDPALARGVNVDGREAHLRGGRRGARPRRHAARGAASARARLGLGARARRCVLRPWRLVGRADLHDDVRHGGGEPITQTIQTTMPRSAEDVVHAATRIAAPCRAPA